MIPLITDIEVGKSARLIYQFLLHLDKEKYCQWHPAHQDFAVIDRTPQDLGSILYFKETVDGTTVNFRWRVTELIENQRVKMQALFFYPVFLTVGLEAISAQKTVVHHRLDIGYKQNFFSPLADGLVGQTLFSQRKRKSQQRHAVEEYKRLEQILD